MRKVILTAEQRELIEKLAGVGLTHDQIGGVLDIAGRTVERHAKTELRRGLAKSNARLAQSAYAQALGGNARMLQFLCRVCLGWREPHSVELVGAGGSPLIPAAQPELHITQEVLGLQHHPIESLREELARREASDGTAVH